MLDIVAYLQLNLGLFIFSQNDTHHYIKEIKMLYKYIQNAYENA